MSVILGILSKFIPRFRKKKTVIENLEEIDKQTQDFEKYKQKNEVNERKYIGALVIYSIILYILGAIFYYIYLMPTSFSDRVKTSIPFFISPFLIYSLRRFLKWFFIKRTKYYAKRLEDLRKEKKLLLEEVKENQPYNKAKEILDRFGDGFDITPPASPKHNRTMMPGTPYPNGVNFPKAPGTNLVHRNIKQLQMNTTKVAMNSPINQNMNTTMNRVGSNSSLASSSSATSVIPKVPTQTLGPVQGQQMVPPPPPSSLAASQARTLLPRPIITPNRTFFDKILDYIIGEGPNNRYALICKNCHFHNGMALKEEFEYVAFRCAYCLFYNEARKTKLNVPVLNNRSTSDNTKEINTNIKANESAESSTLSSSDSMNDVDQISDQITSETQKISSSQPNLNSIGDNKKMIITQSLENIRLDSNGDKNSKTEEEEEKTNQ